MSVIDKESPATTQVPEGMPVEPKKKRKPFVLGAVILLVVVGLIYGIRFVLWSQTHASTDDAAIAADLVQISPQVTGTVVAVHVKENEAVKKGQLLVELDDASYQTAVLQAKASLDLAIAQSKGASANVALTEQTGNAQIQQAQGIVQQSTSGVAGSFADVSRAQAAEATARAQASGATAGVMGARSNLQAAIAAKQRSQQAVTSAQAQLQAAISGVGVAKGNLASAQATADRATRDNTRIQALFRQGAVSAQAADQAQAAQEVANAQVQSARQQVELAQATVEQRQSEVQSARTQVTSSEAVIQQAQASVRAAQDQENAARQGISAAQAQRQLALSNVQAARGKGSQASGQLAQAKTAGTQVKVSQSAHEQADARVEQAKAVLHDAEIQLQRTKIYAPVDGRVSKKSVTVGALVQPGAPLMAIVEETSVWVVANYKETQLGAIRVGLPAEIEVDAFPGRKFRGHVDSLSAGTGSTFALLPPDNATGNYTKVVQRVPVKIVFDSGQPDLDRLTVGMSVVATIETK